MSFKFVGKKDNSKFNEMSRNFIDSSRDDAVRYNSSIWHIPTTSILDPECELAELRNFEVLSKFIQYFLLATVEDNLKYPTSIA